MGNRPFDIFDGRSILLVSLEDNPRIMGNRHGLFFFLCKLNAVSLEDSPRIMGNRPIS